MDIMSIFFKVWCVFAIILIPMAMVSDKQRGQEKPTKSISYKLIATVQWYYTFIWDKDQKNPNTRIVMLYEDEENKDRYYMGRGGLIKEYLDQWKYHELTTKQLKNILNKLGCDFESEV